MFSQMSLQIVPTRDDVFGVASKRNFPIRNLKKVKVRKKRNRTKKAELGKI
jgi:hypothetical protein